MALNNQEQFIEAAKRSQNILVALPHAPSVDHVGAALSIGALLGTLEKKVDIIADGFEISAEHRVVPGVEAIKNRLGALQHFLITIPVKDIKLHNLAYTIADDELKITLTPQNQNWDPAHVRAEAGKYRYDTAIIIGAADLEALGGIYREAPEFWKSIPLLNIDHLPANEHFGAVNVVDIHAASLSEVVYELLKETSALADQKTATALLAGIIQKTKNFRTENVTPRTLTIAADLVSRGAAREHIVNQLYRTKNIQTLRLWGKILARLRTDSLHNVAWALLTKEDFVSAGAKPEELTGVLEDLIGTSPEIATSFILHENNDENISGVLHTHRGIDAFALSRAWSPVGSPSHVSFTIPNISLIDAERVVLEKIKMAEER